MGFRVNAFAKVWSVEDKGKFSKAKITIGRTLKDGMHPIGSVVNGNYEILFSDFVSLVGHAHNKFKGTEIPDNKSINIQILDCDVTQNVVGDKKYNNYAIYDFDFAEYDNGNGRNNNRSYSNSNRSATATSRNKPAVEPDDVYDDPFS